MHARRAVPLSAAVFLAASAALAQPALERLEKQLQVPAAQQPTKEQGYLGLITRNDPTGNFIRVVQVVADSPAAQAGVRTEDVILSIDGRLTRDMNTLAAALQGRLPGDRLTVALLRGQEERTVTVMLGRRTPTSEGPMLIPPQTSSGPQANPVAVASPPPPGPPVPEVVAPARNSNPGGESSRIDLLERRVAELERRLAELERLLSRRP